MTYSQIEITFDTNFLVNYRLYFNSSLGNSIFDWKSTRAGSFQVTTGTPTANTGERTAINFVTAFNLDLNNASQYEVTRSVNVVTIKSKNPLETFEDIVTVSRTYLGHGDWDEFDFVTPFTITNYTGGAFTITTSSFSENDSSMYGDKCTYVKMTMQTNQLATNILTPQQIFGNTNNPVDFYVPRNQVVNFFAENATHQQINQPFQTPSFFDISNKQVTINPSPFGANITINLNSAPDLTIEYSLDNSNWQSSSSFSGIASGNYTVYVRDQYGCNKSFSIVVGVNNINTPFFYISKANSFRFVNRINFGTSGNYKNDENTLSYEAFAKDKRLAHKEIQLFNSSDVITTQFKSNYGAHSVLVNKPNNTTDTISVVKKTNNIGLKESLDAKTFAYTGTKTGVYFTSGNTYDFTSGTTNGTHSLYGSVPIWAMAGNYIKIGVNFYLIEDVIYDDNKNSDVIIFSDVYSGPADANVIVGSIYNLKNYEVYEFTIDLVTYLNSQIKIQLQATDTNFQTITMLSEDIDVAVAQEGTVDIHYWNENNTDIYYATGLKNRIRIPVTQIIADDPSESDIHKTDTDTILLDSEMYEGIEITFEPQTKELHRKTKQALLHKFVYIDDVKYVLNGNFDVEQLQDSNLYVLKCKMLKAGNVFSNNNSTGYEFDATNQQIPGLISTQSGFVKY